MLSHDQIQRELNIEIDKKELKKKKKYGEAFIFIIKNKIQNQSKTKF